jgi:transposase
MEGKSMATHRRQYSAEFKAKLVLEVISGEKTPSEVCRSHKLNANVLARWRKEFVEQAPSLFERDAQSSQDQERIAELERLVGQLTMKLEIAKKASGYLSQDRNGR